MRILFPIIAFAACAVLLLYAIAYGRFGETWQPAKPVDVPRPQDVAIEAAHTRQNDAEEIGVEHPREILFGDLHVHSTFSIDAFFMSLPSAGGDGLHPVSDACDFARYCSSLDFFSINDHAVTLNRRRWQDTIDEIRQCNAVTDRDNPDLVAFLGWEWTQAGYTAASHYGHKNVILKGLRDDEIPARPISAIPEPGARPLNLRQPNFLITGAVGLAHGGAQEILVNTAEFRGLVPCADGVSVRELSPDCIETAATPEVLFNKLNEWGVDSLVIPHGTTWGMYTPPGSRWDKQLRHNNHDENRQRLIEVYSGHGNSEEYRPFSEAIFNEDGSVSCPEPANNFLPGCWRAGEIIYERCIKDAWSARQCNALAAEARQNFLDAKFNAGDKTVPGANPADWLDAGQCRDCWLPSFNYRPRSSVQYILALRNFDDAGHPKRFRLGFIASSDNHSARPGTGYKEFARNRQTEARFDNIPGVTLPPWTPREPGVRSIPIMEAPATPFSAWNFERAASWFLTGGLVAVHSNSRRREDIWDALWRQEVYATSGPRILLWFNLKTDAGDLPMGSEVARTEAPRFQVKALGSFEQKPGCPAYTQNTLTERRIQQLCNGECYNPSGERRPIARIEVVRIRPQNHPSESIATLVDDPWKVIECAPEKSGCSAEFTDGEFTSAKRDAVYYVRAIEAPSPAVGAVPYECERDSAGNCIRISNFCDDRDDDCLEPTEERAWSSPIYVNYERAVAD